MVQLQLVPQIKAYIAQLELPEIDHNLPKVFRSEATAFQSGEEGAVVNAGSLVSFVSGLTEQHKSDVLNSTLLAQLAATKQYDRYTQTKEWYDFYISVLAQVGWVVPAFAFRQYSPSGSSLVLSDAILAILNAIATGDEIKILEATLNSLKGFI